MGHWNNPYLLLTLFLILLIVGLFVVAYMFNRPSDCHPCHDDDDSDDDDDSPGGIIGCMHGPTGVIDPVWWVPIGATGLSGATGPLLYQEIAENQPLAVVEEIISPSPPSSGRRRRRHRRQGYNH